MYVSNEFLEAQFDVVNNFYSIDGMFYSGDDGRFIAIYEGLSVFRKIVTLIHEIGHWIFDFTPIVDNLDSMWERLWGCSE